MAGRSQQWHGGAARTRRWLGDRVAACSPQTEAAWKRLCDLAIIAAGKPDEDPAALRDQRDELTARPRPDNRLAHMAVGVLLAQVDLFLAVPAKARAEFARTLHDAGEQAWRLIGGAPAELRHPSVGKG